MKNKYIVLLYLTFSILAQSCSSNSTAVEKPSSNTSSKPSESSSSTKKPIINISEVESISDKVVMSSNKFGVKLFSEILKSEKDKNVFISPLSVAMALTMTYNGANGTTKKAMADTLELQDLSINDVNKSYEVLQRYLTGYDDKVVLNISNSLWLRKGEKLKDSFIKNNETNYNAKLSELDFDSPDALKTINTWVSDSTEGKIKDLLKKIEPATFLYLINALYFKGTWTQTFDKAKTVETEFINKEGKTKKVQTMKASGEYQFFAHEKFRALSLPYGKGNIVMTIYLPKDGTNLDDFYKEFTDENMKQWKTQFAKAKGDIGIPRFKVEYENKLNQVLKDLGMSNAFTSGADFSNMLDGSAFISEVRHKTFVEVNEEGTEAAAATSVALSKSAIDRPFKFNVDRPFFFTISDDKTASILFMGQINDI